MKSVFLILIKIAKINWLYTFNINFRHFGLKGLIKLPIILKYGSKIIAKPSAINFKCQLSFNMLTLNNGNYINIAEGGAIILNGVKACFNYKNSVLISSSGIFEIGNNFGANGPVEFNCRKKIKFGDDVMLSGHILILDTDYHPIYNKSNMQRINHDKEIHIGDKVWIGANVTILKGTNIGNNIVIGACSLVAGDLLVENSIYSGNPIKIIKNDIVWNK